MTTAVIVQARTGSTRLPGKVLKHLCGRTVLEEVLRRCQSISGADAVVCAIPAGADDDALVPVAERAGAMVVRGSTSDVLARYAQAAKAARADLVLRVTSDCPLIDPEICAQVIELRARENADYACNNMPPSFPHGLDCECFTRDALDRAARDAKEPYQREHVTPWLRTQPFLRRANLFGPGGEAAQQRWTLDFEEDYDFLRALWPLLPSPPAIAPWQDIAGILAVRHDIAALNQARCVTRSAKF
jgi:glutamate-1-semialdehyde 2,1-aminomutase/spore coat polysaccharide biosynthesis protein SpsF